MKKLILLATTLGIVVFASGKAPAMPFDIGCGDRVDHYSFGFMPVAMIAGPAQPYDFDNGTSGNNASAALFLGFLYTFNMEEYLWGKPFSHGWGGGKKNKVKPIGLAWVFGTPAFGDTGSHWTPPVYQPDCPQVDFIPQVDQHGNTAPVPEPATILLLGSGLAGLTGFGRKRLTQKNPK